LASGGGDDAREFFFLSCSWELTLPPSGAVCVYSVSNSVPVVTYRKESAHEQDVNCVKWNPLGNGLLATVGDDGFVKFWMYRESQKEDVVVCE